MDTSLAGVHCFPLTSVNQLSITLSMTSPSNSGDQVLEIAEDSLLLDQAK